jgi:O-antigen/teichoic acid export membrane protein
VCFGLALGLFFVSQGFGRGFGAMSANAARLLVSAGAGLAAVYWLDLGIAGFFTAIATGFALYAAVLAYIVLRVRAPQRPG